METTLTFEWNDAKITVRRAKVRDRLAQDAVQVKLAPGNAPIATIMAVREYGRLCTQSEVKGDVGFPLVPSTAPVEELEAGYQQWLDADAELMDIWQAKLRIVDGKLYPDEDKTATDPKTESAAEPRA